MGIKSLALIATTAMTTAAYSEPAPGATFDFQCVTTGPDGELRAEFEHFIPLTDQTGQYRTIVGNAIGRHSDIQTAHSFSSDKDTLMQLSETHQRWINNPDTGTPEQMFMIQGELVEMQEGIEALQQSEEAGAPLPACPLDLVS